MPCKVQLELKPDAPIEASLRSILRWLFEGIVGNVPGLLEDQDPEFLHSLRVAIRRTRSAIGQISGVLPKQPLHHFKAEFRWLGAETSPCRDLDVLLLSIRQPPSEPGEAAAEAMQSIFAAAEIHRERAWRQAANAVRASRFEQLADDWRAFLHRPSAHGALTAKARQPTFEVAHGRVHKANRRLLERAEKLGRPPEANDLHRLRIDAKKLRYLLEFFACFFPADSVSARIDALKDLQDCLGASNDCTVQTEMLHRFAAEIDADGRLTKATSREFQRLLTEIEVRRRQNLHALPAILAALRDHTPAERPEAEVPPEKF